MLFLTVIYYIGQIKFTVNLTNIIHLIKHINIHRILKTGKKQICSALKSAVRHVHVLQFDKCKFIKIVSTVVFRDRFPDK